MKTVTNFDKDTKTLCIAIICDNDKHEPHRYYLKGPGYYEWRACWSQMWGMMDNADKSIRRPDLLKPDQYVVLDWMGYWDRRVKRFWTLTDTPKDGIVDSCTIAAGVGCGAK